MNSLISLTNQIAYLLRPTAPTEARTVLVMQPNGPNTKPNPAKTFHFLATAATEIGANSLMATMRCNQFIVGICTRLRNVKTFGKRDSVFTGFAVSFCIRNVENLLVR
jgi:hypothetical protein